MTAGLAGLEPAALVRRVQLAVVKSRSNSAESGTLDDAVALWPRLYGTDDPLAVLVVTERMLARGDAAVTTHDAYNVLALAHRDEHGELFRMAYYLRWEQDAPAALDYLREQLALER